MKNIFLILTGLLIAGCSANKVKDAESLQHFKQVHALLEKKNFFKARDAVGNSDIKLSVTHRLILEAAVDNAFNRPAASNSKISKLLEDYKEQINDSVMPQLLELKQANHGRLFEYPEAAATIDEITTKYSSILKKDEVDDYINTNKIWHALKNQPKQDIIIIGDTKMKMSRDKANLANLEVKGSAASTGFIFDTGANISTVTRSTAQQFNMKMLDATIEVGSITGGKVQSALAVCPEIKIGNITIKNAVFLVFEDKDLAFPQIDYQINGILGFPVIEAMKEVQITITDEFIVPKQQSAYNVQNMAMDFLNPVMQIGDEYYTFDTGATGTSLYKKYYERHKADIEKNYSRTELQFGGAGGMKAVEGYKVTFTPVINNRPLAIKEVQLYTATLGEKDSLYYGNIGQDLIKQFSKMTLNFEQMFIKFD